MERNLDTISVSDLRFLNKFLKLLLQFPQDEECNPYKQLPKYEIYEISSDHTLIEFWMARQILFKWAKLMGNPIMTSHELNTSYGEHRANLKEKNAELHDFIHQNHPNLRGIIAKYNLVPESVEVPFERKESKKSLLNAPCVDGRFVCFDNYIKILLVQTENGEMGAFVIHEHRS